MITELEAWNMLGKAFKERSKGYTDKASNGVKVCFGLCCSIKHMYFEDYIGAGIKIIMNEKIQKELVSKDSYSAVLANYDAKGAKVRCEFCARMIAKITKKKKTLKFK